jgi:cysteine-rich repeat protein
VCVRACVYGAYALIFDAYALIFDAIHTQTYRYGLETCDDGNTVSGDGCSSKCMIECGNDLINGHETCDDGNVQDGDGCSSACSLEHGFSDCSRAGCSSHCGDGIAVAGRGGCESSGFIFRSPAAGARARPLAYCFCR